jgi:hypothetical protein
MEVLELQAGHFVLAQAADVEPFIQRVFQAPVIKVERINVNTGFHRAPGLGQKKTQSPKGLDGCAY